ncbi:MAG: hypothetical protein ABSE95_04930 [Thermodesulfobacteriota bacterium]|jgi:hypothetical protein
MKELPDLLVFTGEEVIKSEVNNTLNLAPFKKLRYKGLPKYLSVEYPKEIRFLSFFLINLLEDIFYNLIGDFPYEDSFGDQIHAVRKDFFKFMSEKFIEIGKAILINDYLIIPTRFTELVVDYLTVIEKINTIIDEGHLKC